MGLIREAALAHLPEWLEYHGMMYLYPTANRMPFPLRVLVFEAGMKWLRHKNRIAERNRMRTLVDEITERTAEQVNRIDGNMKSLAKTLRGILETKPVIQGARS